MIILIESIILCAVFTLMVFIISRKPINTLYNYPPRIQERVMNIYAYARKFMAEHGNPNQWGKRKWPPEELIRADIDKGCRYEYS